MINKQKQDTALVKAATDRDWKEIRRLIDEEGANVNAANEKGETILFLVAEYGKIDGVSSTVHFLLAKGANPNIQTQYKQTPLMMAAHYGANEVSAALLKAGADYKTKDWKGVTALAYAENGGHTEIVKMLKDAGAKE